MQVIWFKINKEINKEINDDDDDDDDDDDKVYILPRFKNIEQSES